MEKEGQKNYMGIDWGATDVGVAVADHETRVALAYATLANDGKLLESLGKIFLKESIGTVVIGIPSYINHETAEYSGEKLGKSLKERFPFLEIAYQDEMFTTKMAQANLIERGTKQVSKHDDEEAARIILQEWLDTRRNEKEA